MKGKMTVILIVVFLGELSCDFRIIKFGFESFGLGYCKHNNNRKEKNKRIQQIVRKPFFNCFFTKKICTSYVNYV